MSDRTMLRLFTAVPLDPGTVKKLTEVQASLESGRIPARWIPPEKLHLTLHFLGNTPANLIEDLQLDLGACAHRHRPFDLALGNLGCFPDMKKPRVLWAGVKDTHRHLDALVEDCRRVLNRYRLFKLEEDYVPHLTLGRLSPASSTDLGPLEALLPQWPDLGRLPVEKFNLYESKDGKHTILREFFLKA